MGERLHLTRWQVGRLLKEALAKGIVRIEIVHPRARSHTLETDLVERTGLREAIVVPSDTDPATTRQAVAQAAADYLADLTTTPRTLAVSWGQTMSELARAIAPSWADGVTVVQANGGLSRPGPGDPAAIITTLARQARGSTLFLPAPAVVESPELAAALLREPSIAEVTGVARGADVLLFSLGAVTQESVLVQSGCLSLADVTHLLAEGAVGDAVGRFIGADGAIVCPHIDARSVGLQLADVAAARLAIAVAAGSAKHAVAEACVRRGLCHVLVTDEDTAVELGRRFIAAPIS
ncbi:sugar-binding transcriptional regulator [Aestuariimicrobium sp. Y1814]|uniref:sugar-binding transcriptional regulator n=1 Tax=Aestuariimicrobium sp. Y1814 TaxID=3418742 RepID=UPI003DA6D217